MAKSRGLALRITPYSNSSQIVTLFTRDFGVLTALARGSKRPVTRSSPFSGPFDLLGWYDLVLQFGRGELALLYEANLIEGFEHLRRDLDAFHEACFVLETLRKLFRPFDPAPDFLRQVLSTLKALRHGHHHRALRIHYSQQLLLANGLLPNWEQCAACQEATLTTRKSLTLRLPEGVVCADCRLPEERPIAPQTVHYLIDEREWGPAQILTSRVLERYSRSAWFILSELMRYETDDRITMIHDLNRRERRRSRSSR